MGFLCWRNCCAPAMEIPIDVTNPRAPKRVTSWRRVGNMYIPPIFRPPKTPVATRLSRVWSGGQALAFMAESRGAPKAALFLGPIKVTDKKCQSQLLTIQVLENDSTSLPYLPFELQIQVRGQSSPQYLHSLDFKSMYSYSIPKSMRPHHP